MAVGGDRKKGGSSSRGRVLQISLEEMYEGVELQVPFHRRCPQRVSARSAPGADRECPEPDSEKTHRRTLRYTPRRTGLAPDTTHGPLSAPNRIVSNKT